MILLLIILLLIFKVEQKSQKMGCQNTTIGTQDPTKAHHANCFFVSCMDFRTVKFEGQFMEKLGYHVNYDEFALAGASLGFTQDKYPHWGQTLLDHMAIGHQLHQFKQFIFMDHKDCGAFRKFYPGIDEEHMKIYHKRHMQMAHDTLAKLFPNFRFRGYLMELTGQVQQLLVKQNHDESSAGHQKLTQDIFLSNLKLSNP